MTRVLHIFNELRFSGAEMLLTAGAAIFQDEVDNTILSTGNVEGEYSDRLKEAGYRVRHLPFRKSPAYLIALRNLIKAGRYDLIHVHAERANFWHASLARSLRLPCLRTVHAEFRFTGTLRLRRAIQRRLLEHLGVRFIACSAHVAEHERRTFGILPKIIENWLDPSRVQLVSDHARTEAREALKLRVADNVIVTVGNYSPVKNQEAVVAALRNASPSRPLVYLHCGSGGEILQRAMNVASTESIRFEGAVSDIRPYLLAADAFICSSHQEGGPIALLEAAACGIPCVTTRVGLSGALRDQALVRFVEPTPEDLLTGINNILDIPLDRRLKEGPSLALYVLARFSPDQGARAYLTVYRELATKGR